VHVVPGPQLPRLLGEELDVRRVRRVLDDVAPVGAGGLEDVAEVLVALAGLGGDVPHAHDLAIAVARRDAGGVQEAARRHHAERERDLVFERLAQPQVLALAHGPCLQAVLDGRTVPRSGAGRKPATFAASGAGWNRSASDAGARLGHADCRYAGTSTPTATTRQGEI